MDDFSLFFEFGQSFHRAKKYDPEIMMVYWIRITKYQDLTRPDYNATRATQHSPQLCAECFCMFIRLLL